MPGVQIPHRPSPFSRWPIWSRPSLTLFSPGRFPHRPPHYSIGLGSNSLLRLISLAITLCHRGGSREIQNIT